MRQRALALALLEIDGHLMVRFAIACAVGVAVDCAARGCNNQQTDMPAM
jgi:hypothetical protein